MRVGSPRAAAASCRATQTAAWDRRIVSRTALPIIATQGTFARPVRELAGQRVHGMALCHEDLDDHDALRADGPVALLTGKAGPGPGVMRPRERDRSMRPAASSTLNRLELGEPEDAARDRCRRIAADADAPDRVPVDPFLDAHAGATEELWLNQDATDGPLRGNQEVRFFRGYDENYRHLPLHVFCGEHPLCARLRRSNRDAGVGGVEELTRIVGQIRERWPPVRVAARSDSGFAVKQIPRFGQQTLCAARVLLRGRQTYARTYACLAKPRPVSYPVCGPKSRRTAGVYIRVPGGWSRCNGHVGPQKPLPEKPSVS